MYNPEEFTLSTDFATLKNDARATVQVTFPGSTLVPGPTGPTGGFVEFHTDVAIGSTGAISRVQISSSKDLNTIRPARNIYYSRSGSAGLYQIVAFTYRISPTVVRCIALVPNPNASPMTTESGNETFTFYVNTFIPPFAS